MGKNSILKLLKSCFETVHRIAKLEVVRFRKDKCNDFTYDEITTLDDIGRLSKFIHPSPYLSNKRSTKKRKINAIKNISEQHGTTIRYKYP